MSGYLGSFIILVPGAQTFESLKDLMVFLCIVLFGYPALLTVPFAYGLSDLIEGVPPGFLLDWLAGYFINPSCFWIAYQLFGKNPDFRQARTWWIYLVFVFLFMSMEPVLWGYICAGKFTSVISYGNITPALFFTTSITWIMAPFAMLAALPLARKIGMFWAEIPGHVNERRLGSREWIWEAGGGKTRPEALTMTEGWPIRMVILAPFIGLMLLMVGTTAYVTLRSAEEDANKLVVRLHQEISDNINLQLDEYLAHQPSNIVNTTGIRSLLQGLPLSKHGLALIIDNSGHTIASSAENGDAVAAEAAATFIKTPASSEQLKAGIQFRFDHITEKPLSRETWLACATAYEDRQGGHADWVVLTLMPESFYLAGIREGNSRSAMIFAIALLLSLAMAAVIAALVTGRLRLISLATQALTQGDLAQRVPGSRLEELDTLAKAFNNMAEQLKKSFDDLLNEVETRKRRESQLEESENRLRTSEDRLQLAIRTANLAIWDWDVEKNQLLWDDSMYQLYGVSKDEFSGAYEAWSKCLAPEDFARVTSDVETALRGEREFSSEFHVRLKDGSTRFVRGVAQTIRSKDGRPLRMVGINWDMTERLALEQQLRQSQKMDAIGQLAGGVAHDFNNILAVVMLQAQITEMDERIPQKARDELQQIRLAAERGSNLTRQLLLFSRKQVMQPLDLDLNEVVTSLSKMLDRIIGDDIQIHLQLNPTALMIHADAGMIEQVLMNLAVNARDAMSMGGSLRIETSIKKVNADLARLHPEASPGHYVCLSVADTGTGIPPDILLKIFEPFFTTKEPGKGTGLGLATVFGIVKQHKGWIQVESKPEQGTCFRIFLPACAATSPGAPTKDKEANPKPHRGTETILLVEDDASVRALTRALLELNGYSVVESPSGAEALTLWPQHLRRVALVLTDLVMPGGVGGQELARRVREDRPDLKIIFTSGYSIEIAGQALELRKNEYFVQKPCPSSQLLQTIRTCLDG
ncbi:MAG: ATP-binding protein [Methylacidiphilales bacterium]|nr:ATP-binding protein [Candidatus Methylacidiphilales bacterium]